MRVALAAALALGLASPAAAAFGEDEREAIRDEVRAYLLENPGILREMIALLEAEEAEAEAGADQALIAAHADAIFADGFSVVGGNPDGDVTVVEFIDYQCGFCRRAHPEVQALLARDDGVRLITKEFPILGPGSELAARATLASLLAEGEAAYRRLGDVFMRLPGQITDVSLEAALREAELDPDAIRAGMNALEVTRRIEETRALARAMSIQGTPTFVIEDRIVRGYVPLAEMERLVAEVRAEDQDESR